jgi:hypothetical protein
VLTSPHAHTLAHLPPQPQRHYYPTDDSHGKKVPLSTRDDRQDQWEIRQNRRMSDHNEDGVQVDVSRKSTSPSPTRRSPPPHTVRAASTHYYPENADDEREDYVELSRGGTRRSHPPSVRPTHYYPAATRWDREDGYTESDDEADGRRDALGPAPTPTRYYHPSSSTHNSPYREDVPETRHYYPDTGANWQYVDPSDLVPSGHRDGHRGGHSRRGGERIGRKGKLSTPMHPTANDESEFLQRRYDEQKEFGSYNDGFGPRPSSSRNTGYLDPARH